MSQGSCNYLGVVVKVVRCPCRGSGSRLDGINFFSKVKLKMNII